eukprot:g841.t1
MKEEDKGKNTNSLEESSLLIKPEVQEPTTERKLPEVLNLPLLLLTDLCTAVYFVQGIVSLSTLATSYFLKDSLLQSPAQVEFVEGFGNIPWVVKPIYGFASDSIPLFGYRRRSYLILCGLLSSTAWCLLGTNISSITGVLITLVSAELGTAFSDVVVDSIVVERVRGKPQETAASLQVICWASRAVGGIISAYYSGYIVDHFGPRVVFRTVACFPLLITISSFLVKERKLHDPLTPVKQFQSSSGVSRFSNKITSVLWTQSKSLWSAFSQRRIYLPALFMFLYQAAPNASSAMFFYETNELHFTPEFMGKVALIGQIASLLGVGVFNFFLKSVSLKKVFAWSCILTTIIGSSQFILISRINRDANNQPQSKQLLSKNSQWMTETDLCVAGGLMAAGYGHLFSFWPASGLRDEIKKRFLFAMMAEMKRVSSQLEPLRLSILRPPTPQSNPTFLEIHGEVRIDSYHWLRDHKRSDPKVLSYLTEENNYFAAVMADTNILRQQLYNEMKDRTQEDDTSAPLRFDGYYYYTKTIKGKQHRLHCRRKVGL